MEELTKDNYFTHPDFLHSSQIKDYIENPYLYLKRHVEKDENFQFKVNTTINKGSAIDEILTEGTPIGDIEMTPAVKRDVEIFVSQIPKFNLWQMFKKSGEFQKIVKGEIGEMKMCGKLDVVVPNVGIFDLKITTEACAKNAQKWMWHSNDLKYAIPSAIYSFLEGNELPFYHVPCYIKSGVVYMKLYRVTVPMIEFGMDQTKHALNGIKNQRFDNVSCSINNIEDIPWENNEPEPEPEPAEEY